MEILSGMRLFSSAFLGTTASLIGFLLLLFWAFMIVAGIKVKRPLYRMLCVVLCAVGFSMLLGFYGADSKTQAFAGGVLGHWVSARCSNSGTVGFSLALLWIAVPAAFLLATDWLFLPSLFGGRGLPSMVGNIRESLLVGLEIFSAPRRRRRPSPPRKSDPVFSRGASARPPGVRPKGGFALSGSGGRAEGNSRMGTAKESVPPFSSWKAFPPETAAFEEGSAPTAVEEDAEIGGAETGGAETRDGSAGVWWKAEAVMEEEPSAAGPDSAAQTASAIDLDKSWWAPPTAPLRDPEPEVMEEPLAETAEEPVAETVEEPAAETVEEPLAETAEEPVAETVEEPAAEAVEEPAAEAVEEPLAETAEEPEAYLPEEGESLLETKESPSSLQETLLDPSMKGEAVAEEEAGPVAEASPVVMEPEPQAEFSFARDYNQEPPSMSGEETELFKKAVTVVVREKKGSISLLQRELGLGYFKAAKLLNILETQGIVAPYAGSIARKVIIGEEQAQRIVAGEGP